MSISLVDVARYYSGLPHQEKALDNLQQSILEIAPHLLQNFAEEWRTEPQGSRRSRKTPYQLILDRLKDLGIRPDSDYLDRGDGRSYRTTILALEGCNPNFTLNNDAPDRFNDIVLAMKLWGDGRVTFSDPEICTTEPGAHYTRYAMNPKGAARVKLDVKHPDIWKLGYHFKEPNCLVQTGGKITVLRDRNKDFSRVGDREDTGYFGINFHHGYNVSVKGSIGKTSAGCLVIPKKVNFYEFINKNVKTDCAYKKLGKDAKFSYVPLDASKIF